MGTYSTGGARRHLLRRNNRESGASLVELAIILPLLLLVVVGAADFGRAYYHSLVLTNAARAGATFGAFSAENASNISGVQAAVEADLVNTIGTADVAVTAERLCSCTSGTAVACDGGTCPSSTGTKRTYVRVRVDKVFTTMLDYPGVPHMVPMSKEVHMRAR